MARRKALTRYLLTIYQARLSESCGVLPGNALERTVLPPDSNSGSDVVMADQLCGQSLCLIAGTPRRSPRGSGPVRPEYNLETCFLKFQNGRLGAANGLRPEWYTREPDATHPLEVWTNLGLLPFLLQGMNSKASD